MTPKRTSGILQDIEKHFGPMFLDELWHNVQFGRSSGITCIKVIDVQHHLKNRIGLNYTAEEAAGITSLSRKCVVCEERHEIELEMTLKELIEAWAKWTAGGLIQDHFADTMLEDREFMMSSICPACFDGIFTEDD